MVEYGCYLIRKFAGFYLVEHISTMAGFKNLYELTLELFHFVDGHVFEQTVDAAIDYSYLVFNSPGMILRLHKQSLVFAATVDDCGSYGVDVATEFGEGLKLTILSLSNLQRTGHLLHRLNLGAAAYTANGDTYVYGRTDTLVEEGCLKEDLTVGN